jgi:hypothetical protein
VVDVMKDQDDTRDVLINKLFRFKLKNRFKDNKNKPLTTYVEKYDKILELIPMSLPTPLPIYN